ncbi:MAG: hypothetical protein AAF092_04745 [Pseudomonadota bacterium]
MKALLIGGLLLLYGGATSAQDRTYVEIVNPDRIATEAARHQLKYLASCALAQGTVLRGSVGEQRYEFPGAMGLAPHWGTRALSASERRWVSACILARTNAFGANVLISMRNPDGIHAVLNSQPEELESHTLYEGGFFGDVFAEDAVAFVCIGADHAADIPARLARKRVCTHPTDDGSGITQCGFVSLGLCPTDHPPLVDGAPWPEIIHVWLKGDDPQ